jgi:hypothetical protein
VERVLHDPEFGRNIGERGFTRVSNEFGDSASGTKPAAPLNR